MSWFGPIIDFCVKLVPIIQDTALDIINFMSFEVSLYGVSYSSFEFLFGSALIIVFTFAIIKFVAPIV